MNVRALLVTAVFAGVALPAAAREAACPLGGQRPMLIAELFFGRDVAGRKPVSASEWSQFAATTLTRYFPDGFTAFDADGQWLNSKFAKVIHEPTKVVIIAALPTPDLMAKLDAVRRSYMTAFHQQSVGVITRTECAAF